MIDIYDGVYRAAINAGFAHSDADNYANLAVKENRLGLLRRLEKSLVRLSVMKSEHWISTHDSGSHLLIDGDGTVLGGAGGSLNGKKLDNVKSKSPDRTTPKQQNKDSPSDEPEWNYQSDKKARQEYNDIQDLYYQSEKRLDDEDDMAVTDSFSIKNKADRMLKEWIAKHPDENHLIGNEKKKQLLDELEHKLKTAGLYGDWDDQSLDSHKKYLKERIEATKQDIENRKRGPSDDDREKAKEELNKIEEDKKKNEEQKTPRQKIYEKHGIAGNNWNGKIYGRSGEYSIYINGNKKTISNEDASLLNPNIEQEKKSYGEQKNKEFEARVKQYKNSIGEDRMKILDKYNNRGFWNGKIYGNKKYGFRIYIGGKEYRITESEAQELNHAAKSIQNSLIDIDYLNRMSVFKSLERLIEARSNHG